MQHISAMRPFYSLLFCFEILDNYKLFKNSDGTHAIDVEIKGYKQSFKADDIYNLMNLLGDWLCKLPKSTWVEFNF